MKKAAWKGLIALGAAWLLGACGGGESGSIPSEDGEVRSVTVGSMQPLVFSSDKTSFTTRVELAKNLNDNYEVAIKPTNFIISNCQIQQITYTPQSLTFGKEYGIGYTQALEISGTLGAPCSDSSYSIELSANIKGGGITRNEIITFSNSQLDGSGNDGGDATTPPDTSQPYSFYNVPDRIDITTPGVSYEIKAQLLRQGFVAEGKTVRLKPFDSGYGYVSSYTAVTGTDGYAVFNYVAPRLFPSSDTTLEMVYFDSDTNETYTSGPITLRFNQSTVQQPYRFTVPNQEVEVNRDNEIKTVSATIVDQDGVGVPNLKVSITAITDDKYGSIVSDATALTDASGRVYFTYRAPSDIAAVDGNTTQVRLFLSDYNTVVQNVTFAFKKIDENVSIPIVVIADNYKEINLTQNSQNVPIEVQVFDKLTKAPYTKGNVKVLLPSKVLDGADVGSFAAYTVTVGANGKALFNYTGPQDLQSLINAGDTNSSFTFFHEDNPSQDENVTVVYDLQAGYIPADYRIDFSSEDGSQTMNLKSIKSFTVILKDDQDKAISSDHIQRIVIESKNTIIASLIDTGSGNLVATLEFSGLDAVNPKSFSLQTTTVSGLVPLDINITFTDANGNTQERTLSKAITVFSGPPTAMSISYTGVEQNASIGKYIEKFAVSVTDAYNNPVNTKPYIAVGAIVEYAVDGSSPTGERNTTSPRLWSAGGGTLEAIGGNKAQLTVTQDRFNYVDINNDKLVLFGGGYVYEALGKWDIASISNNQTLLLWDDYNGSTRSDLGYAVGHNARQDLCSDDGREYIGNMRANTYQLNENGHALVEFEYDYHLTGKDIMVWVNLIGYQADNNTTARLGEATKHTLRGVGLQAVPQSYTVPAGTQGAVYHFEIKHTNAPEWYQNGRFAFSIGGNCKIENIVDSSNRYDARSCVNNGVAFVDINVTDTQGNGCTVTVQDVVVADEF